MQNIFLGKYTKRMTWLKLLPFVWILLIGCRPIDISRYSGDGKIETLGANYFLQGFKITFDEFNLAQSFSGHYEIINLPDFDKTCWVGLEIISKDENIADILEGTLSIQLVSMDRKMIFQCVAPLSRWRVSQVGLEENKYQYYIYYIDSKKECSFKSKELPSKKGLLSIEYEPNKSQKDITASVQLVSGGMK